MTRRSRILLILMIICYALMIMVCIRSLDGDSYGAYNSYAIDQLSDKIAIILYVLGIVSALSGLFAYDKDRKLCRILGWILFFGIVLDMAFLYYKIVILMPVLLAFSVIYLCVVYPGSKEESKVTVLKERLPDIISILILIVVPVSLVFFLFYMTDYNFMIHENEPVDFKTVASILISMALMIFSMVTMIKRRDKTAFTKNVETKTPADKARDAFIAAMIISILLVLFIPIIFTGHEEKGQHMDIATYVNDAGETVTEDVPGVIEYYIVYSPLDELFIYIVSPVAMVVLAASVCGALISTVLVWRQNNDVLPKQ